MTHLSGLPGWLKRPLRFVRDRLNRLSYVGRKRYCPVCGMYSRKFGEYGVDLRPDARCIHCGSLERDRLIWLFMNEQTDLWQKKDVLHVAPEACFEGRFRKAFGNRYITADLYNPSVMVQMDIQDIDFPDGSFDVVYCSHVLEHVPDDRKAMSEFYRILRPGGWAILPVPILRDTTYEDSTIVEPEDRLRNFGQEDHVRIYGRDYKDRLEQAGFEVQIIDWKDYMQGRKSEKLGINWAAREIVYCRKG